MPVIMEPKNYDQWLDPRQKPELLKLLVHPDRALEMTAYPVSTKVNNPKHDAADCIAAIEIDQS